MSYGYDAYDRFNQLSATSAGLSAAYTYGFTTNTNLIATISDTSGWTETMSYETNRDLLGKRPTEDHLDVGLGGRSAQYA